MKTAIIDDELSWAKMFERLKGEVYFTNNVQDFIQFVQKEKPDRVIVDLQIKGQEFGGFEILERLNFKGEVIVFTRKEDKQTVKRVIKLGYRHCDKYEEDDPIAFIESDKIGTYTTRILSSDDPQCEGLNEGEANFLKLKLQSLSEDKIAEKMFISKSMVRHHSKQVRAKTGKTWLQLKEQYGNV